MKFLSDQITAISIKPNEFTHITKYRRKPHPFNQNPSIGSRLQTKDGALYYIPTNKISLSRSLHTLS